MWIVLLDLSSSMGEPFQAENLETLGRVRIVEAQKKIDAAKKSFLIELERLLPSLPVILLGFRSTVIEVYKGQASEYDEFKRRIEKLQPDDGTDIAVALQYLLNYEDQKPQVLLISDGQSPLEPAKAEAHSCANAGIRIDMLVIDPTEEGLEMAKAIAGITQGRWEPVTSAEQLAKKIQASGEARSADLARAEEFLSRADLEYQEISKQLEDKTRLAFSAGYPSRIHLHRRYPLVVYIHLEELQETIQKFLMDEIALPDVTPAISSSLSSTRIPRGTLITVQPNIPDIFANPPRQEVVWLEDYHKLPFNIQYSGTSEGASCAGFIDILALGVIIGHIPVSITVESESQGSLAEPPMIVVGNPYARVFASYSHHDDAVVQACKETYKALGIHLYVDRDDLLSGQPWRDTLRKMILKSDLFQLYWSQNAADSTEVAHEWRLALDISRSRTGNFIRPLFWKYPLVPPPTELGHLHFTYLEVDKLLVAPKDVKIEKEDTSSPWQSIDVTFPVIALIEKDATAESMDIIQKSIGQVVPFLEYVTGLRYYPPTTLLVDEYTVKSIRSFLANDNNMDNGVNQQEIGFALEILRSSALAFHMHMLDPEDINYDDEKEIKQFYGISNEVEWSDFQHVRIACEGIYNLVKEYLEREDPSKQPHWAQVLDYGGNNNTFQKYAIFSDYLDKWFEAWLNYLDIASSQHNKYVENYYTIPLSALDWLRTQLPDVDFQITSKKESWEKNGSTECTLHIQVSEIHKVATFLRPLIIRAVLSSNGVSSIVTKYFTNIAHTYGIFANSESENANQYLLKLAKEKNWPEGIALIGNHKILVCIDALERYKSALLEMGLNEQRANQMAAWFIQSVLVHEHFHAIAATGLDKQGGTSWAVTNWDEWHLGNTLNESLAAWMEKHFFRDNDAMFSSIIDYIHSGPYPDWPYRGADKIEEIYQSQGLPGVREWIRRLREDPPYAQKVFDKLT